MSWSVEEISYMRSQPLARLATVGPMRAVGIHHVAVTTNSFDRMRAFYVDILGLTVLGGFSGQEIVFLDAGGTAIELIGEDGPDVGNRARRAGWHHLAWEVEDVDAAFAELVAHGVPVHSPPESFPGAAPTLRIAFLRDPDGNLLELVQPLRARYPGGSFTA